MNSPANSLSLPVSRRTEVIANIHARTHTSGVRTDGSPNIAATGGDIFCFGRYRLAVRERLLMKDDAPVTVGSRAFDLLLALVERAGETVNRKELFDCVWPDVVVAKVNLRVHIAALRKALGDRQDGNRFIVSVAGRGYRFVAPVGRFKSVVPAASQRYSTAPSSLPPQREFGHDAVVAVLGSQLSRKRFVCLGGPGGWGHTGVAFALAHTLATDFDDAVCCVDLAGVDDPASVATALAVALGCEIDPQQSLMGVLAYLQGRKTLLAFENCEHVFAGVAQLTERLFAEAPLVQVLISSRKALHLSHAFAEE